MTEERIGPDHPIRCIEAMADAEVTRLSPFFDAMYAERGRPPLAPDRLRQTCVLICALQHPQRAAVLRAARVCNLLLRWFLDMGMHEELFDTSTFAKNKEQLLCKTPYRGVACTGLPGGNGA